MTRWPGIAWVVLLAAGCEISVGSSDKSGSSSTSGTTDPSNPAGDDDDDVTGPTSDTSDTPPTGTGSGCGGTYDGAYGGASAGDLTVDYDPGAMEIYVSDVDSSALFIDGILDVAGDGSIYGESQGFWMEGTMDFDTCEMGGDWGAVELPGVVAGWWEAGP